MDPIHVPSPQPLSTQARFQIVLEETFNQLLSSAGQMMLPPVKNVPYTFLASEYAAAADRFSAACLLILDLLMLKPANDASGDAPTPAGGNE